MSDKHVSVVVPALDEADTLETLVASLSKQSLIPREVLIVDGGSTDGSPELVRRLAAHELPFELKLLEVGKSRPGRSRNLGTRAAASDIVACTDCGVQLDAHWLEELTKPLFAEDGVEVSIGAFSARGESFFEDVVGHVVVRAPKRVKILYAGGVSIAYHKHAWERVGGYAEDVYPCEDAQFLRDLAGKGARIARAYEAMTYWRPRKSLALFARQYRSYAWGDAMIGLGWRRHALRLGYYTTVLALLCGALGKFGALAAIVLLLSYFLRPAAAAYSGTRRLKALLLGPLVLATKDLSQIVGYAQGSWNRLRGGSRDFGLARNRRPRIEKTA